MARGTSKATRAEAALAQAQDLVYAAWQASTSKRRKALAEEALAVSPHCADAYVLLAGLAPRGSDQELDLWRRGVEAGTAALGKSAFDELSGSFWGFLETRPYMRARFGLARAVWLRGDRDGAIAHLRDMLRLNPGDNQGVRYILAAYLIEAGDDDGLAALLREYPDEGMAAWPWTSTLAAFRRSGDGAASRKLLRAALRQNEHVPAYLLGDRRMPKRRPPFMSPGGRGRGRPLCGRVRRGLGANARRARLAARADSRSGPILAERVRRVGSGQPALRRFAASRAK